MGTFTTVIVVNFLLLGLVVIVGTLIFRNKVASNKTAANVVACWGLLTIFSLPFWALVCLADMLLQVIK